MSGIVHSGTTLRTPPTPPGSPRAGTVGAQRAGPRRRARLAGDVAGVAPAALLYTFLLAAPAAVALLLSCFSWNGVSAFRWAGLANWDRLFHDGGAAHSLLLTIVVTAVSWFLQTALSMAAAAHGPAHQGQLGPVGAVRAAAADLDGRDRADLGVAAGAQPGRDGIPARTFHLGNSGNKDWLGDPSIVLYIITVIVAWQFVPFYTLLYRTARQQVPRTLYEAAAIDGATGFQAFRHVTLPQLRNTIASSSVLVVIGTLTYFDMFFLLTDGGPGTSSRVLEGLDFDAVVNFIAYNPDHVGADIDLFIGRTGQYVFISSASAYQKPVAQLPIRESTPLRNPYWAYSRDKIASEERLTAEYREHGFPVTIVRPSHTYDRTTIPLLAGLHCG